MRFSYNEDGIEKLRAFTSARWPNELGQSHGVEHWDRVAKFGQMLYVKDADRMDLLRVGITPLPDRMATQQGAEMVAKPTFADFYYDLMGW